MGTSEMIFETNEKLQNLIVTKWLNQDLFSLKWWVVLGFIVFSYILCFTLLDKTRLSKTILFGSLVSVFTVIIEILGTDFNLWAYTMYLFPMTPNIFIYDITALPLYFMLIFQRTNTWKKFIKWDLILSLGMGFIFSPLVNKWGLMKYIHWGYIRGFLTIFSIGFFAKAATCLIIYVEEKYLKKQKSAKL